MQVPGGLFVAVMAAAAAENGVVGLETMSTSPRDTAGWIDGSATELAIAACFVALLALCAGKREKQAADDWAAALGGGDSVGFHGSASLDGATGDETRGHKGKTGFKATKRRASADLVDLDPKASTTMMTNPLAPKGFGDQWSYRSSASRQEDPMSQESLDGYIAYQGAPRPYQPTIPSVPRGRNNKVTKRRTTSNPDDPGRTASESPPVIAGMGVTPLLTLHTESQESVLDDVTIAGDDAPSAVVPSAPASAQPSLSAPGYLTIDDDEMSAASSSDGPGVYADAQAVTPEALPPPRNVYAVPTDLTVTDPERHPSATMTSRQARATLHTTTSSGEMSPREAQELVAGVDGGALSRSDAQAILGMETAGYVNASAANPGYVNVATQRRLTAGADHDNAATTTYYKNYATAEAAPPSVPGGGGEPTAGRETERRSTSSEVYDTFKKATDMDTKTFMMPAAAAAAVPTSLDNTKPSRKQSWKQSWKNLFKKPAQPQRTTEIRPGDARFGRVERLFRDGGGRTAICKVFQITNPALEARWNSGGGPSEPMWHGTGYVCLDASCESPQCALCGICRDGFRPELAREDTHSYHEFGANTWFAIDPHICDSYNARSERPYDRTGGNGRMRMAIMSDVRLGVPFITARAAEVDIATGTRNKRHPYTLATLRNGPPGAYDSIVIAPLTHGNSIAESEPLRPPHTCDSLRDAEVSYQKDLRTGGFGNVTKDILSTVSTPKLGIHILLNDKKKDMAAQVIPRFVVWYAAPETDTHLEVSPHEFCPFHGTNHGCGWNCDGCSGECGPACGRGPDRPAMQCIVAEASERYGIWAASMEQAEQRERAVKDAEAK